MAPGPQVLAGGDDGAAQTPADPLGDAGVAIDRVDGASLDALAVDDLVVFVLAGETPLGGAAALVDWRLCGKLSQAVAQGAHGCGFGERVLWPAPPQMRCARLLVWGLGPAATLDGEALRRAVVEASTAARAAGGQKVAVALPALAPTAEKRANLALQMLFVRATATLVGQGVDVLLRA